ncbi:MAG: periplasmic heavy metal sensor [Proteobacteria bacterium]|nr:periplasmic heavy metal sensor [Desulfobacula sp.]MBU3950856.1 periplasmic heavy metal sensor [Pseudomonadota bacterium]MBU4129639.1 periplasmic heavy metal sensor [Pseudomonadota bacterium]
MKKSMIVITSFLAVALLATNAFSWGPGKGCGGSGQGYGAGESAAWNDLSKQQKDELTALNQKFIDETYEVRSAMMTKHQEMRLLMETSSPDRAKLEALSKAVTDLQGQMQTKRIDYQLAAKKIAPELSVGGMGGPGGCGPKGGSGNCPRQDRGYNQ